MKKFEELVNDKDFEGIIVILDNDSNILNANDKFLNLLGMTFNEIREKNIVDLIVPDEKTLFFDLDYKQGVSNILTLKFYHKSGAFRFFSFSILNFIKHKILFGNTLKKDFVAKTYDYLSSNNSTINSVFDKIEVNDIKDLLNFEDNTLTLFLSLIPIEVWVKDRLGKYIYVNENFTKATGVPYDMCIQKDDFQLFSSDTAISFVEADELAKKAGKKISFSFENTDKSMASFAEVTKVPVYNKTNEYIGLLGFSVNTSHSKLSEKHLEDEKNRLTYIIKNIDVFVFELSPQFEFLFLSDRLKKLINFDVMNSDLMNAFQKEQRTVEVDEKLNLAFNGEKVSVITNISGKTIQFNLTPIENIFGTYNIIGFGEEIIKER